jgi:5-methylthioribose kinase
MLLSNNNIKEINSYLKNQNWIESKENVVHIEKPGEGNMNFTLRVQMDSGKSLIVKQSKNYVEKYPTIPAPANRAVIEGQFYQFIQKSEELATYMPKIIGIDETNNIIALEDLGESTDFTFLYNQEEIVEKDLKEIVAYLGILHKTFKNQSAKDIFVNKEMRKLNHEHIFVFPFMIDNGFDLNVINEGLQEEALLYKTDEFLKIEIEKIGDIYLQNGKYLLHGDYYPGSFLKTANGIKIIDPEFCFYGFAEFDLAVLIAHLKMSFQKPSKIQTVLNDYQKDEDFNENLLLKFVGIEIMRRIIGLAQLPLTLSLAQKKELLKEAKTLILN